MSVKLPYKLMQVVAFVIPMLYKNLFFYHWLFSPHIYIEPEKGESREGTRNPQSRPDTVDMLLSVSRTDRYCARVTSCMQKRPNVPCARSNASAVKRGVCSMSAVSTISMSFSLRRSCGRRPSYSWGGWQECEFNVKKKPDVLIQQTNKKVNKEETRLFPLLITLQNDANNKHPQM